MHQQKTNAAMATSISTNLACSVRQ